MDEMINRLKMALESFNEAETDIPLRDGFQYTKPHVGLIEWMPIMQQGGSATVKMVGYHPTNPAVRNLPTIVSTISVYDTNTGHLIGLADATFLTALRTGAASAVASQLLASPDSQVVGLIGAGAQAMTQLHAISRVFNIKKVLVYDIDPLVSDSFLERTAFMGLNIAQVGKSSLDVLVKSSDIICTATSVDIGYGPVFEDTETKPWLHINAVGSDFPGKVEVPSSFLRRSFICPDFPAQAIKEGECQQLSADEIGPSLVELVQNKHQYAYANSTTSVFDSTGWAVEDQVAMALLLDYAEKLNLGTSIQIESISNDPRNPYQFVMNGKTQGAVYV